MEKTWVYTGTYGAIWDIELKVVHGLYTELNVFYRKAHGVYRRAHGVYRRAHGVYRRAHGVYRTHGIYSV